MPDARMRAQKKLTIIAVFSAKISSTTFAKWTIVRTVAITIIFTVIRRTFFAKILLSLSRPSRVQNVRCCHPKWGCFVDDIANTAPEMFQFCHKRIAEFSWWYHIRYTAHIDERKFFKISKCEIGLL